MKNRWPWLVFVITCAVSAGVQAASTDAVGATARDALELQRSGAAAAPTRPMLKPAADRSYERYLESFSYPIPERFDSKGSFDVRDGR